MCVVCTGMGGVVWGHEDPGLIVCAGLWCRGMCAGMWEVGGGSQGAGKARVLLVGHFGSCFLSVCGSQCAALCR